MFYESCKWFLLILSCFFFTQAFMKNKVLSLCFSQNQWPPQLLGSAEGAIPGICRRSAPGFTAAVLSSQLDRQNERLLDTVTLKKEIRLLLSRWICNVPGLTSPTVQIGRMGCVPFTLEAGVCHHVQADVSLQEGYKLLAAVHFGTL